MKNLIFLLFVMILLSSCDMSKKEIENSAKSTTVELQEAKKDTIVVSLINNTDLYVFNENNLVVDKYKIETVSGVTISVGVLTTLILIVIFLTSTLMVILFQE